MRAPRPRSPVAGLLALGLALAVSACSTSSLDVPSSDGGEGGDGGVAQDGPATSAGDALACNQIHTEVAQILAANTSCMQDSDCTIVTTACDLSPPCGTYASFSVGSTDLGALVEAWTAAGCSDKSQACNIECPASPPPACVAGTCRAATTRAAGAVGDACTGDAQCATGSCITETEDAHFKGGMCTQRLCAGSDIACPMGSACVFVPTLMNGEGTSVCLPDCTTNGTTVDCRTGYFCCGFQQGECVPSGEPVACPG